MLVYMGIDWSSTHHDVCFMNEKGGSIFEIQIPHSDEGIEQLHTERCKLGMDTEVMVGIETSHNPILDYLVSYEYHPIYVIPPIMVKSCQGRYGNARSSSDRSAARLIADILRTDRARLKPWQPDCTLTQQIRERVSLINFLTHQITQNSNRLRAVLNRYYPQATKVFSKFTSNIALEFIQQYPSPQSSENLSLQEFFDFAHDNKYPNRSLLPACYKRLQQRFPNIPLEIVEIFQQEAVLLAKQLKELVLKKDEMKKALVVNFEEHPDAFIFKSLPGAGEFLAPALLSKFGDNRSRYPNRESVQAVAGTCPVTRSSGKRKQVIFRRACDREFRTYAQQWARESMKKSSWANTYFESVYPRCDSASHAYRCLANRWLAIAWRLWYDRKAYDENYHLRQRALRAKPISKSII